MSKRYQPTSVKSVTFSTILIAGSNKVADDVVLVGKAPRSKKGKSKQPDKIQHPEFIEASKDYCDEFWESILIEMAYNKCPSFFAIKDNKLIYRYRNKIESMDITEFTTPIELSDKVIHFLKVHGRLKSHLDLENEEQQMREILAVQENKIINPLSNDSSRTFHIHSYVNMISNRYGLNKDQWNQLVCKINMTYFVGLIDKSDFIFNDGQLIHVNGIIWNNTINQFDIDPIRFHSHSKTNQSIKPLTCDTKNDNNKGFNFDRNWQNIAEVLSSYSNKQINNESPNSCPVLIKIVN